MAMRASRSTAGAGEGGAAEPHAPPLEPVVEEPSEEDISQLLNMGFDREVAVEALQADFWYKYVGLNGAIVGMTSFGESAPAGELFKLFGFTVENVVEKVKSVL